MKHAAFLSYARSDDEYSRQAITKFKQLLQSKLREITGENDLTIFHDREIPQGVPWQDAIYEAIKHDAPIFIAAITPSYLNSIPCRDELEKFLARENVLGRKDLIFPIYLVEADEMEDKNSRHPMAGILRERQMVDFRQYYKERFRSKDSHEQIAELAKAIKRVSVLLTHESAISQTAQPSSTSPTLYYDKEIFDGGPSVYKARISHFEDEKLFLADKFGEYLLARLKRLCNDGQSVVLLIDSGTTLYHFFPKLGDYAVKAHPSVGGTPSWTKNLTVVTNNLTGVDWLMKHGRNTGDATWSEIALNCILLSGIPLPAYSAITGSEELGKTQRFLNCLMPEKLLIQLRKQKDQAKKKGNEDALPRIIALITGNWIRIRQTSPRYPVPLARGRGHLSIKQNMIDLADEVYVVTPLGKIFADHEKHEIEVFLNELAESQHPSQPQYREVKVETSQYRILSEEESASKKIKLVTTYRPEGCLLSGLSSLLQDQSYLSVSTIEENNYAYRKAPFMYEAGSNLMFLFDELPKDLQTQMEKEFPHSTTRTREFLKKFHVPESLLKSLFPS